MSDFNDFFYSKDNNKNNQKYIIEEACARTGLKLNNIEKIILYSSIYTKNKQGLSSLSIANFINLQISSTGKFKPLKTKAYDKSKKMINNIEQQFEKEVKNIIKEYQNKC